MKWMRGIGAGLCLALALSGCSNTPGKVDEPGVYSPLIVGISVDHEPAIRSLTNELTALISNVNGYPITYHWRAGAGTLLDSTSATVNWVAPDSIGTYPVTVSIESHDTITNSGAQFFKTMTFQILVDNEYVRWTTSPEIQYDPAPVASGGLVYAQFRNVATGEADIYYLPGAGLGSEQKTQGFFTANSPTMRSDGLVLAFAARATAADSQQVWISPGAGADPTTAGVLTRVTTISKIFANPRFTHTGNWLMYNSDSGNASAFNPRVLFRDIPAVPPTVLPAPERVFADLSLSGRTFWTPNWGPDVTGDGLPDSIVTVSFRFFHANGEIPSGFYKAATRPPATSVSQWLADSSAAEPDWSADGKYIVFSDPNTKGGERDIWIIRADTNQRSAAIRVTHGPADDSHPRFSPDGNTIYFVSNRVNNYGLNGIYGTERRGTNLWSVTRFDRP
jgi:Tol biopolymer transport system component